MKLEREVFATERFTEWSKQVVLLEMDFPRGAQVPPAYMELRKRFGIRGFPSLLFLDADAKRNLGKTGYIPKLDTWFQVADQLLAKAQQQLK